MSTRAIFNFQIPVVVAVEGVGRNLQNHPVIILVWKAKENSTVPLGRGASIEALKRYFRLQDGK